MLSKYDVNVLGMEQFGARKETPLETCINEVKRSDIYFENKENQENQEIEIIARLLFSSERINRLKAIFSDKEYLYKVKNPDYDPNNDMHKLLNRSYTDLFSYNPEYITETETIKSDSMLLLSLSRKVEV